MRARLIALWHDEAGAVTVDWVVLTAAIVGMGVASVAAVRTGVNELGADISQSLSGASLMRVEMPYMLQGLTAELAADRVATYANATTEQIVSWHTARAASLVVALQNGHHTPTGDWGNLSAGETLDVLYLHRQELMARGAYPVAGVPSFDALQQTYFAGL